MTAADGQARPQSAELIRSMGDFFARQLISLSLVKRHPHASVQQRCGLASATLELDMAAHPNIDYIAGNRLSVYPVNPADQVAAIARHLLDDLAPPPPPPVSLSAMSAVKRPRLAPSAPSGKEPWSKVVASLQSSSSGAKSAVAAAAESPLKFLLTHLYDISTAPSRDLLKLLAAHCSNQDHRTRLLAISASDDTWERWICSGCRSLRSTLDEYHSCQQVSARQLLLELPAQQPRQYSISSIKSSKRFRVEILVFQHQFSNKHIAKALGHLKERESQQQPPPWANLKTVKNAAPEVSSSSRSMRSLRSVANFSGTPISSQQVHTVPAFTGPFMSQYASSKIQSKSGSKGSRRSVSTRRSLIVQSTCEQQNPYEGLCSNYLLKLNPNDTVLCEFVENPRFTLKGNRERPIMMIGQDVGLVAFRPFWQQRALEHDRAQVFYTLFKDLTPKKFGEMHLVCVTGNKCRIEDLFKREIQAVFAAKILSSTANLHRSHLLTLLERASDPQSDPTQIKLEPKGLQELGFRMAHLLMENNGCLYTCCDAQLTQAIEILIVESVMRKYGMAHDKVMALLPQWKGRKSGEIPLGNNKFLFTLENPFEKAQIVQEIYENSI